MNRLAFVVLVWLPAWPALGSEDKSPSPRQQYDTLLKLSQLARQEFNKALRGAKTDQEQQKATKEYQAKISRIAVEFLALVEKNPKAPVAIDALSKVFAFDGAAQEKKKAADLLLRDYLQSDKIAPICQSLSSTFDDANETLLRMILAKNPNKNIQAEASFALAQEMHIRSYFRKQVPMEFRDFDLTALESDVAKIWSEFAEKHSATIPEQRLALACMQLCFRGVNDVETAMRILAKDKRRTIRGIACLILGQILKRRADTLAYKDDEAAAKLRSKSEEKLSRAAYKYGDVNIKGLIVGEKAKHELFELRRLSIGIQAPDIVGEDQDGKQFNLSDYKGKAVLLDFWSQH